MKILRIITLTLCPSETSSRNYSGKISGKKILKSASVASTFLILCPVPCSSPSPLLNFFFTPNVSSFLATFLFVFLVDLWVFPLSVLHLPSSPRIHTGFNTDSSTSSPAPLAVFFSFSPPLSPCPPSCHVKRRREQDRSLRLVAEGAAGHHLFVFTSPPPGRRRREERMKS